ncbi:MAG: phage tail protein [Dysgonamonadaceae bacterium]|jgi:hypothetical protein|nr:phage tail protein [Dysgonamonadaceae bacterium]
MKKIFFTLTFLTVSLFIFAQGNSGLGFNYQAVVRGTDGFVLPKQEVELRFSLMPGQTATQASWIETHKVTTDALGTIGITVGKGTKAGGVAATFADVNFAAVHYWMKVEIKEGSSYRELSYTALASVPYAEAATNAVSAPVGSIMPFAGDASKVPAGWLLCDGKAVSRSEYAALYEVIGTAWGFGNNSTTFNLPDMRGMFLRGLSGNSGKDTDAAKRTPLKEGGNSGNNVGSYQGDAIRNITGSTSGDGNRTPYRHATGAISKIDVNWGAAKNDSHASPEYGLGINFDASRVVPVGADNRPQNVYVNYIIKY